MPSRLYSLASSSEMMTEKWASQPRRFFSCACTMAARGFVRPEIASAISTSSECSRGFRWPRQPVFMALIGSITDEGIRSSLWSMPAIFFSAFSSSAADAPSRGEVRPVTTLPSASTMAPAGFPVATAFSSEAATAGQMSGVTPACCITSSSFRTTHSSACPLARSTHPV